MQSSSAMRSRQLWPMSHFTNQPQDHIQKPHSDTTKRKLIITDTSYTNSQKRLLGTYFRVAFVGSLFEDIDGAEFVYKEPTVTTLAEVSLRLKDFYGGKYGVEKVHLLQDSGPINHDTLDPELAYIQVTHVEPFFDETERMNRITAFERVVNVNRFVFEAPYTLTGKSHGTVKEQCKRKTIVTTAKHFPYVRSRIAVVAIETINLTPVDVAIEAIKRKTEELNAVVSSKNIKMLQLVLSGAVSATVNEGPLGMAQAFIPIGDHSSMAEKKRKNIKLLQEAFALFLQACGLAVDLNTQMCLEDQQEYAQNLDEKYTAMLADFRPYLKEQQMPIIRRKMATLHNNSLSVRTLSASATISTNGLV
ncbi:hypothetical protein SARC_08443 [Sphaeroforma arctica JP610]|uniref:DOCKER domain-containing protein n=1 Tax=Sphaeroforma arctica JP610 TaxID=667725 RepID=A0A0L0FQT0_9EUKA|nr:hypothetical protein SARC_08443 [Sphaeroforma arctica JP610]KNC79152.1 hypothetical protein SARC_08443 [Sphaeroforma arctica JP610]|eukprot:XP_014153054.1 hypothetical protein SARC_08443 [Sphaeroforma arctica JP610]